MLAWYIGKDTIVVEGSPSGSKPILEDQVRSPSLPPVFDGLKEVGIDIQQGVQSIVQSSAEGPPPLEKLDIATKGRETHPTAIPSFGEKQSMSVDMAAFKVHGR